MPDYLEYTSDSDHNFKAALLRIPEAVHIFARLDQHITAMVQHLGKLPELTARDAFFFIGTFVLMFQRQSRNGFSLLCRRMSYDALLVLRPGIEAVIFAYRIFREPRLLEVWARRNDNFREFSQEFRRAEIPGDMPHRDAIAREIDFLNDYWAHPSINYFASSIAIADREIRVHFFDHNDPQYFLVLLSFLDICIKAAEVFRRIWTDRFNVFVTSTEEEFRRLMGDCETLKARWRERTGR